MRSVLLFSLLSLPLAGRTEPADLRAVNIDQASGVPSSEIEPFPRESYVTADSKETVTGEMATLSLDARQNWEKACELWKKSVAPDTIVLINNCGTPSCHEDTFGTTCQSIARRKFKFKF